MSKLQQLLGDLYREDMTIEQIEEALAKKKLIDKADFDKKASELAEANRQIKELKETNQELENSNLTDQQRLENDRLAREQELTTLKVELARTSARGVLLEAGLSEAEAEPFLSLINTQDKEEAINVAKGLTGVFKSKQTALEKDIEARLLKDTPKPGGTGGQGDPVMTKDEFSNLSFTEQVEFKQQNPQLFEELLNS